MKVSERRRLGRTGLEVPIMGFGGAPLGNMYTELSDEQAVAAVHAAYDTGSRFFDTAPFYGFGLSEHRIGDALRWLDRDSYVLSTKVGRLLEPKDPATLDGGLFKRILPFEGVYDYSYDGVMRSLEASLQRLGTYRVDVLLIHDVDVWTHGSEEARLERFGECMNGAYKAMVELREQGVIGAIGAGINEVKACEDFARAGDFDTFLLAGRYSLLEQGALDSLLPLCEEKGISLIIGGPYNTGILATGAIEGAYYNYHPAPPRNHGKSAQDRSGLCRPRCRARQCSTAISAVAPTRCIDHPGCPQP